MVARAFVIAGLALSAAAPAAMADNGGVSAPSRPASAAEAGGAAYGAPIRRPVASVRVGGGSRPLVRVRIDQPGGTIAVARLVVYRLPGSVAVAQVRLGRVPVGRTVSVRLPRALGPGRYVIRVHAHDGAGHQLRRVGRTTGRASLVIRAPHRPTQAPPPPPPAPVTPVTPGGVFPVAGPHGYGDGFGAPRKGYRHQGQDITGARGTPIVAPLAGTILTTGYQARAAGEYVVLDATDGHAYFFAHCIRHSTLVAAGQAVVAGAQLCGLGATGDATGPHLHFEEWVGGWRVDAASHPVDPLAQLRAWDH